MNMNCKLIQQIIVSHSLVCRKAQIVYVSPDVTQHRRLCFITLNRWVLT